MTKNKELFIEYLVKKLKDHGGQYYNAEFSIPIFEIVKEKYTKLLEEKRGIPLEVGLITDTIMDLPISIEEQKELFTEIVRIGYKTIKDCTFEEYIENFYLPIYDIFNFLKNAKSDIQDLDSDKKLIIATEISKIPLRDRNKSKYKNIIEEYLEYRNYENIFNSLIYSFTYMIEELENGKTELNRNIFDNFVNTSGLNKKFYRRITRKHQEKQIEEFNVSFKFEQKSNCLTDKEYKDIKKKLIEVYDVRTATLRRNISYSEIYDIANDVYIVYGIAEIKPYFDNLMRAKEISKLDYLKYLVDKLLFYKDLLSTDEIEDLDFYVEMLNSDELDIWINEIESFVKNLSYKIPSNGSFEKSKIRGINQK